MDRGFSLIEVLVATVVMMIGTVSLAQVVLQSVRINREASSVTLSTLLAVRKMEQLRALEWASDESGRPISDTSTNTTTALEQPSGGTGLALSPTESLSRNTAGYCDFVDAAGRVLSGGTTPPPDAAFVRRWSISPLPASAVDTLVLQVSVVPVGASSRVRPDGAPRNEETRIMFVKSRKGR
jgi:prepilin-type N-terminal cleavage/methylation domain-containing protein